MRQLGHVTYHNLDVEVQSNRSIHGQGRSSGQVVRSGGQVLSRKRKSITLGYERLFKIGRSAQVVSSEDEGLGDYKDASKQGRKIADIDADAKVTLIDETQGKNDDNLMFDTGVLDEHKITTTITTTPAASKPSQDKGKAKMIKSKEPLKMKLKDQVLFDEQQAIRLQAQFDEEERIAREKEGDSPKNPDRTYDLLSSDKPAECEVFKHIVDFLNANPIKYVLTVNPSLYTSCIEQLWATAKAKTVNGEEQLQVLVDRKKVIITESSIRRDLQLEDAEGVNSEEAINEENVPTHSNDPLLSGEDRLKLVELMKLCTNLQNRVLDLEHTKTTQALEIESLKRRVKKLEKKQSLCEEDASKQGSKIHDIDADEDITLDCTHFDIDPHMFGVHDLDGDEVFVEKEELVVNVAATASIIPVSAAKDLTDVDMTLANALAELKNAKPKATTTVARIAREKEDANVALIAQWNDIQDKVETDYELAQRLQAEEQKELTIEEKSKLF
ncbi:hypothetical protein Tco_0156891 [Tanacetum coccineum]